MFCPECGTKNEEDAVFCEQCGMRLGDDAQPPYAQQGGKIGLTKKHITIISAVAAGAV